MIETASQVLKGIHVKDLVDIVILTVMISALLVWFKKRASRFVLIGISVLGVIYFLARSFHLYLTTQVLHGFFAIFLFVVVVIFQEDLRRLFERLALIGPFGKSRRINDPDRADRSDAIVGAVENMARKKIGALIVIKGRDPLDRHLTGGVALDGLVSQPLLESIFDPHSPGHDGAVIVEGPRISRFGCHLPLSTSADTTGRRGLRHTAALGLAERSDALCIVCSEERGTISIARGETIETLSRAQDLRDILKGVTGQEPASRKTSWVGTWLRKNTREKAIAFGLACLLWVMFGYQREPVYREFPVPIEYANVTRDLVIEEAKTPFIRVVLAGSPHSLDLINPQQLKISLNMSQVREGSQEMMLTRDMVRGLPSDLTVASMTPVSVTVSARRLVNAVLPVEVVTKGKPPDRIAITKITVHPSTIQVLLPQGPQAGRPPLQTYPVDLSQIRESTSLEVPLLLPPNIVFAKDKKPVVRVTVTVRARRP